jgi:hypothetical protein
MRKMRRYYFTMFDLLSDKQWNLPLPELVVELCEECNCGNVIRHHDWPYDHKVVKIYKLDKDFLVRETSTRDYSKCDRNVLIIDNKYILPLKLGDYVYIALKSLFEKTIQKYIKEGLYINYFDDNLIKEKSKKLFSPVESDKDGKF